MNQYYFSSSIEQLFLLICLFLTLVFSLFIMLIVFRTYNDIRKRCMNVVFFLALLGLMCKLADEFSQIYEQKKFLIIFPAPTWLIWLGIAGVNVFLSLELVQLHLVRKKTLDSNSIKNAMDSLPEGICYFTSDGILKLCNLQMYRLFYMLKKQELQYLDELSEALHNCGNNSNVVRISNERNTYLFPDGKVWRYRRSEVTDKGHNTYIEIVFCDLTVQYHKNLELKRQTNQLKEISKELRQLSDNVSTMVKEKEVFAAKTRLHNQMGEGLIAVRRNLMNQDMDEVTKAIKKLHQVVNGIKNSSEDTSDDGEFIKFLQDAENIGVKINCLGELPKHEDYNKLFIFAMRECLTNSVCHADATELSIKMENTGKSLSIQITNNGTVPESEVIPRGGLGNLRRYTLDCGGTMKIQSQPYFALTIIVPSKEEKNK